MVINSALLHELIDGYVYMWVVMPHLHFHIHMCVIMVCVCSSVQG